MIELLFAVVLSIGAVDALIPLMIIVVLIVAAAGATRGYSIFNLFGIATLAGIGVGRGSISGRSAAGRFFIFPGPQKLKSAVEKSKGANKEGFITKRVKRQLEKRKDLAAYKTAAGAVGPISTPVAKRATQAGRVRMAYGKSKLILGRVGKAAREGPAWKDTGFGGRPKSKARRFAEKGITQTTKWGRYAPLWVVPPAGAVATAVRINKENKLRLLTSADRAKVSESKVISDTSKKLMRYALWVSPPVAIAATVMRKYKAGKINFKTSDRLKAIPLARATPIPVRTKRPTSITNAVNEAKKRDAQRGNTGSAYGKGYVRSESARMLAHDQHLSDLAKNIVTAENKLDIAKKHGNEGSIADAKSAVRSAQRDFNSTWSKVNREITGRSRSYIPNEFRSSSTGNLVASMGQIGSMTKIAAGRATNTSHADYKQAWKDLLHPKRMESEIKARNAIVYGQGLAGLGRAQGGRGRAALSSDSEARRAEAEQLYDLAHERSKPHGRAEAVSHGSGFEKVRTEDTEAG